MNGINKKENIQRERSFKKSVVKVGKGRISDRERRELGYKGKKGDI